jgi:phage tail sheath protein FI
MAGFFHGVETQIAPNAVQPVSTVPTAIIGLVGCAPQGPQNTLTYVQSRQDAEQFGGNLFPATINRSLDFIFNQGAASVIVVNVFDPATMNDLVSAEAVTIANGRGQLDFAVLFEAGDPVVAGGSPWTTYTVDTDYTIDEYGLLKIVPNGSIAEGSTVYVTYYTPDYSGLASADFIGVTTPARTGFKLFAESLDTFNVNPKIFICPEFSAIAAVAQEMEVQAESFRAVCFVDAAEGLTRGQLVSARTTSGTSFSSVSTRLVPCGPWHKSFDYKGQLDNYPLSAWAAGVTSNTDSTEGHWVSPSNHVISGVVDAEYAMVGQGINDPSSDANLLNSVGIMTTLKVGGARRLWGNRSAAWPSETGPRNFISVQRVESILHESLELAMLPFIDQPLLPATIDAIKATANGYIATQVQLGALLIGSECIYDSADNPPAQLALGQVKFRLVLMPPTPAERITFISYLDINLLSNIQ